MQVTAIVSVYILMSSREGLSEMGSENPTEHLFTFLPAADLLIISSFIHRQRQTALFPLSALLCPKAKRQRSEQYEQECVLVSRKNRKNTRRRGRQTQKRSKYNKYMKDLLAHSSSRDLHNPDELHIFITYLFLCNRSTALYIYLI